MPISPLVREMFDSLSCETDVQRLISASTQENLYLEFKQKTDPTRGEMGRGDAKHFSKALSGFANADGGVLVWGVETDNAERATALRPIDDVYAFQSALKSSLLNATQPVVDDVELEVILSSTDRSGFVKCLIPSSEKTPHRAMLADREYFKRSTEGFYKLEHFDLEDLFGRRPIPRLRLRHRLVAGGSSSGPGGRTKEVRLELVIANEGRGSARAPYIDVRCENFGGLRPLGIASGGPSALLRPVEAGAGRYTYVGGSDFVIHPGVPFVFGFVSRQFSDQNLSVGDSALIYTLAAENGRLEEARLVFPLAELLGVIGWNEHGPT
jgi:hypothetical protein